MSLRTDSILTVVPDYLASNDVLDKTLEELTELDKYFESRDVLQPTFQENNKVIENLVSITKTSISRHAFDVIDISKVPEFADNPHFIHIHGVAGGIDAKILGYDTYVYGKNKLEGSADDLHFVYLSENLEREAYEKLFPKPRGFTSLSRDVHVRLTKRTSRDSYTYLQKPNRTTYDYGCCLVTSSITVVDYLYNTAMQMIEHIKKEHPKIKCDITVLR